MASDEIPKYMKAPATMEDGAVAELRAALERLLQKSGRPSVLVADRKTGKRVQFAGAKDEPLLLDLPTEQILSAGEHQRATALLGEPQRYLIGRSQNREVVTFQKRFAEPVVAHSAALWAVTVMINVFDTDETDIELKESP